jgi:hypothetical protein
MMIDEYHILYDYLNEASALKSAVGTNIFMEQAHGFSPNEEAGIIVNIRPGENNVYAPLYTRFFDIKCYGGSSSIDDSWDIYRKIHDILHGKTNLSGENGFIIFSNETTSGQLYIEPEGTISVIATYQIRFR